MSEYTNLESEVTNKPKRKRLSDEERLAKILEQENNLHAKANALRKKVSEKARKERNNYLYKLGGAVNQVLKEDYGKEEFRPEDVENLIAFLKRQDSNGNYFLNAMNRGPKPCGAVSQKQPKPDPKEEYVKPEPSYPDDYNDFGF